ncbi:hypothetical protein TeGR_g12385 [Tetraparma gracilis]|uniref:Uncharacterized protein n=1 Tax=Tetraparma gracilis TaxID=2962635 RepID=A0ABQ6MIP3_9STRA|nr:hypothetical protein TeGR_g12385 [Tetraparma gracilis]
MSHPPKLWLFVLLSYFLLIFVPMSVPFPHPPLYIYLPSPLPALVPSSALPSFYLPLQQPVTHSISSSFPSSTSTLTLLSPYPANPLSSLPLLTLLSTSTLLHLSPSSSLPLPPTTASVLVPLLGGSSSFPESSLPPTHAARLGLFSFRSWLSRGSRPLESDSLITFRLLGLLRSSARARCWSVSPAARFKGVREIRSECVVDSFRWLGFH